MWEYILKSFLLDIPSYVKKDVGTLFGDLVLRDLSSGRVIILVPFPLTLILHYGDIVTEMECSKVVDHSVEVIACLHS